MTQPEVRKLDVHDPIAAQNILGLQSPAALTHTHITHVTREQGPLNTFRGCNITIV